LYYFDTDFNKVIASFRLSGSRKKAMSEASCRLAAAVRKPGACVTRLLFGAAAAAILAWASSSLAQVIYKSTMPDGRVIYGTEPAPGAKQVETMKPPTEKAGVQPVAPKDSSELQRHQQERQQQAGRENEIQQAEKALQEAEAALAAGKEPLPGERQGTAGGASRLTDQYWERQRTLEAAVAEARKQLDDLRGSGR